MKGARMTLDQLTECGLTARDQATGEVINVTQRIVTVPAASPTAADVTAERDLQRLCEHELTRNGIEYLHLSPRSREKAGWPDLTFVAAGKAFAVELKTKVGRLRPDQFKVLRRMDANGWLVRVIRDFDTFARAAQGDTTAGELLQEQKGYNA